MGEQVKATVKYVIQTKLGSNEWVDNTGLYYDTIEEAIAKRNWLCGHLFTTEENIRIILRITTEIVI